MLLEQNNSKKLEEPTPLPEIKKPKALEELQSLSNTVETPSKSPSPLDMLASVGFKQLQFNLGSGTPITNLMNLLMDRDADDAGGVFMSLFDAYGPKALSDTPIVKMRKLKSSREVARKNKKMTEAKPRKIAYRRWTKEEDQLLLQAVTAVQEQNEGKRTLIDWRVVTNDYFENTRSVEQCKKRWRSTVSPDIDNTPFTPHEEQLIRTFRDKGLRHNEIADHLPGRVSEQIRAHCNNMLDCERSRAIWTDEEEQRLTELQEKIGNRWGQMVQYFPGRTSGDIKNHWHNRKTRERRQLRRGKVAQKKTKGSSSNVVLATSQSHINNDVVAL